MNNRNRAESSNNVPIYPSLNSPIIPNININLPSVNNIETLTSMGFSRETALQTLIQSNNDLQLAIQLLVG